MIFHFQVGEITFFPEDRAYFEKRFSDLEKLLGSEKGDKDSLEIWIFLSKSKQKSGDRFSSLVKMSSPHHGIFHAKVTADNIKKCADMAKDKLKIQISRFHKKNIH